MLGAAPTNRIRHLPRASQYVLVLVRPRSFAFVDGRRFEPSEQRGVAAK